MPPPSPPPASAVTSDLLSGREHAGSAGRPGVPVSHASYWRKLLAFSGPGYLVAVGYMDPGNWATGLGGGSAFGYQLLCVIVLSNLMAMFLQSLAVKLGIVTGLDLAQACRARYGNVTRLFLWVLCEIAI